MIFGGENSIGLHDIMLCLAFRLKEGFFINLLASRLGYSSQVIILS